MEFVLKIKLGNEAMQTSFDIVEAMYNVSQAIYNIYVSPKMLEEEKPIFDRNGNKVGTYVVNGDE